jgi:hypothetical protein
MHLLWQGAGVSLWVEPTPNGRRRFYLIETLGLIIDEFEDRSMFERMETLRKKGSVNHEEN